MICFNAIRIESGRLVGLAFTRSNVFTYKSTTIRSRALHKLTVDSSHSASHVIGRALPTTTTCCRLKREDLSRTKYDSIFSDPWKVLVCESDWKDHSMGKEGAEKYRKKSIPNCTGPCAGVYELGATILQYPAAYNSNTERILEPSSIVGLYAGETNNVRARLQQYGRSGGHLATLFFNIFSKGFGFAIVFRWAPMKSKRDAQEIEAELLKEYDYPWNKRRNGERRPDDIYKKNLIFM